MGLLENMTDFISSQVSSEGLDVELVQDVGGSLLQGMSNTLSTSAPRAGKDAETIARRDKALDGDVVEVEKKQVRPHLNEVLV